MSLKALILSALLLSTSTLSFANEEDFKIDPWVMNPASRFVTQDQWQDILDETRKEEELRVKRERQFGQAKVVTIDTRDQASCLKLKSRLEQAGSAANEQLKDICVQDEENPYTSVMIQNDQYRQRISFDGLTEPQKKIAKQTRNMSVLGAGMVGLIYMLPESVSKWDKEEIGSIGSKYMDNVKAGPVWDKDDWAINYIGHPYSGAIYYVTARHAGLNKWQSFGYSVFMSTVFWEYGFEAVAETPSIQDLVITPVLGSLLGELFIHWEGKIEANNGELMGSKTAGSVALALMDPAGALLDGVNNIFENKYLDSAETYWTLQPPAGLDARAYEGNYIGIGIDIKF